jgi:mono/diheme cytochrome c family protein
MRAGEVSMLRSVWITLLLMAALAACGRYDGRADEFMPPAAPGGATPPPSARTESAPIDLVRGEALYQDQCAHCHGAEGRGGRGWPSLRDASCQSCGEYTDLWRTIEDTMPWRAANRCDRRCARDIAAWIINDFSTVPSCTVRFEYTQITMQDFSASLRIRNQRGRDVDSWILAWTPDPGQRYTAAQGASFSQGEDALELVPTAEAAVIADGAEVLVTLQGVHEGLNTIPDDLQLEAPPCFASAPAQQ